MGMSAYPKNLRRKVGTDLLLLPYVGAIDPGEAPAQAVVREVWEETGLRVVPERLVGVFGGLDYRYTYPNGDEVETTVIMFECRPVDGELRPQGRGSNSSQPTVEADSPLPDWEG